MNNDLQRLKKEILEKDLVVPLLERLGCEFVESKPTRYEAQLPPKFNSNNRRSVQVYKNENLTSAVRSRGIKGDIFTLVAYLVTGRQDVNYLNRQLHRSKNKIIKLLELEYAVSQGFEPKEDPNAWLKKIKAKRSKRIVLSEIEYSPPLSDSILDNFIMLPHAMWVNDGLSVATQHEFEVGFDLRTERIIFPIRNIFGEIVGIKGRATNNKEESKYLYLYPFNKAHYLYNYHKAIDHIQKKREVIVVESEKSVMKLWQMGYKNAVSQMGTDITRVQAEIIYQMHPNIKVILVFDKDKTALEIKKQAEVFKDRFDVVYAMYDVDGLLKDKESPADKEKEIWERLYHNNVYPIRLKAK